MENHPLKLIALLTLVYIREKKVTWAKMHICQYLILIIYLLDSSGQIDSAATKCFMFVLIS